MSKIQVSFSSQINNDHPFCAQETCQVSTNVDASASNLGKAADVWEATATDASIVLILAVF